MTSFEPVSLAYRLFEARDKNVKEGNPIIFLHGLTSSKEHWVDIPQKVADATHRKLSKVDKIIVEDIGIVIPKEIVDNIKFILSLLQEALTNIPAGSTGEEMAKFVGEFMFKRLPDEQKELISGRELKDQDYLKHNADGSFSFKANFKVIMNALNNESLLSEYKGMYDGPACFIYGEKSMFPVNQHAENIKKFFPNAQFIGIKDATHNVHRDAPYNFLEALLEFLRE